MFPLDHDAWAAVGHHLDPVSLNNLASSCRGLHRDISSNSSLWRVQAQHRWPAIFQGSSADSIHDWHAAYKAAHRASVELATSQPWIASIPKPRSDTTPESAKLCIYSSMHATPSTSSCRTLDAGLAWQQTTCVAAAIEDRLLFWKWTSQADQDPPFIGSLNQHSPGHSSPYALTPDHALSESGTSRSVWQNAPLMNVLEKEAWKADQRAAQTTGASAQHNYSLSNVSHTAAVSVLVQVPTGGPMPGFASGSRDSTIKLWTPFSTTAGIPPFSRSISSSSSANARSSSESGQGVGIRPVRTFKGHTDHITALMCLPASQNSCLVSSSSSFTDSIGSSAILVSGSADRSIKLWSLSSVQQQASATNSSSGSSMRGGNQFKQRLQQQLQSRHPMLGTLRGHTGVVTSLLACADISPVQDGSDVFAQHISSSAAGSSGSSSSSSGCGSFLSGGRDCQVKLWDVSEGRRSCVGSWKLQQEVRKLFGGLEMPGCVVLMLENSLQVCDIRVSSARAPGVMSLPHFARGVTAAAVCGFNVAAGGRAGRQEGNVRVWDVRMSLAGSATADGTAAASASTSGSSSAVSRPLLSGFLPQWTVSQLHLDSVKVVASGDSARFNSAAGIGVWNLATGERIEISSSCLSGIRLHPSCEPYKAAEVALGCDPVFDYVRVTMHSLIGQLSETQKLEALDAFNDYPTSESETGSSDWEWASSEDGTSLGDDSSNVDDESSGDATSSSEGSLPPLVPAAAPSWTLSEEDENPQETHSQRTSTSSGSANVEKTRNADATADSSKRTGQECIEPGVLALAVQGPMVACVDSMGNFLLRDFTAGVPGPELLREFTVSGAAAAGGNAGRCEATSAGEVGHQLSHLKFWQ